MNRGSGASVLLVEDNRDDAALAAHVLAQAGARERVHHVADGTAALHAVLGPDSEALRAALRLILLDLHLPGVGGMEVLRRLKENRRSRRIPVVMFTSSEDALDVAACYDLGANGYIAKAADYETFSNAVVGAVRYWTGLNVSISEGGVVHRPQAR